MDHKNAPGPCGLARAAHHTREWHLRPCHSATEKTLPCQGRTPYTTLLSNRAIRCREDLPMPGIVTLQYVTQLQGHEKTAAR
ncbi:uncharacterized protein LOC115329850 isoform X2 [Ixodes scapularis]|uniref:uncharacterized protein LOC115329850 isoform X2 n=1 Tax=Ixodes scapularis TaxID=6945 RepID=UPI001A9D1164|nr:uncharacterized protein LOC115329850 isoform X2 [Ixodes scapularis]